MLDEERLKRLFTEMVQIDSPSRDERALADYLLEKLRGMGIECFEDNAADKTGGNTGNIIAEIPGRGSKKPRIMLSAHLDRVEPGRGIEPVFKDGTFYSAGDTILAADDISGIAAILETIKILQSRDLHCPILLVFTVCEEIGLLGAKAFCPDNLKADFGYTLDCNGPVGDIVVEASTHNKLNVKITGKSSHAGVNPEEGIDAIKVASRAISEIKLGRIDQDTTANIGVIKGGQAMNIVPGEVEMEGEVRSKTEKRLTEYTAEMEEKFEKIASAYKAELEFKAETLYPPFKFSQDDPVVHRCVEAVERLNLPYKLISSGGGSDANIFNGSGIPTLNLATGMEKAHSKEEYQPFAELKKLVNLLLEIVQT